MIDTESGTVVLDGIHAIGPTLTRSAFVASPLRREAKSVGVAKEWPRFFLRRHEVFGDACTVSDGAASPSLSVGFHRSTSVTANIDERHFGSIRRKLLYPCNVAT